jgi:6-phosphofructokinase 1
MGAGRGNLLVGQSGGPTAVVNASLVGVIDEARRHEAIGTLFGVRFGVLGLVRDDLVDLGRLSAQDLARLRRTPSAALGSSRTGLGDPDLDRILQIFRTREIRYFFFIGGNGSALTALRLHRHAEAAGFELHVVAIPKTIDNDLVGTDHCPGHPSVARWLAVSVREAGLDTEAIGTADPVKVIETMGRDTGWVTARTALAREADGQEPHLIYLPERPFSTARFLADVERVYRERGHVVITACEGLKDERGQFITASARPVEADPLGRPQLGGVGATLCDLVMTHLKIKARFDKPGTVQRVSATLASEVDADEAYRVGQAAVREALTGGSGVMVTVVRESGGGYRSTTGIVPLDEIVGQVRRVPNGFIAPTGADVTASYLDYIRPLVGSLPQYARLFPSQQTRR